jgi:23S rRNA pseudouridine2605 synthase
LALCGIGSRRFCDRIVLNGRVNINGTCILEPFFSVTIKDLVKVEGKIATPTGKARLWLYNKPRGLITTHSDPLGRLTVFEDLKKRYPFLPHVVSVGRLDLNSEGLLLLTNFGELAHQMETSSLKRSYRVRISGLLSIDQIKALKAGVTIDNIRYGSIEVDQDHSSAYNHWVFVSLFEGKNKEIRRVFEHFGYSVSRLIRVAFGPYQLASLEQSHIQETKDLPKFLS